MKPRLLVLSSTYPRWTHDAEPGFVHELSKRLASDFDVSVVCPASPGTLAREEMDGVQVRRFRYAPESLQQLIHDGGMVTNLRRSGWKWLLLPGFLLGQLYVVWREIKRLRPDVVHAHWLAPQGFVLALLSLVTRNMPPFVVTSHGADLFALKARYWFWIKRFVGRRAGAITVVSRTMLDSMQSQGIVCRQISVEPMGVDLRSRFTPDPAVPRSSNELLFVGRLVEKKGLKFLVEALPRILDSAPDARLTIVGFGPQEQALRRQANRLGVAGKVDFVGAVPQLRLAELYRRAAVFVAPFVEAADGDQEGLGLVTVEAMGCGCPVVVSDIPAVSDVVRDNRMRVSPGNVEELACAVSVCLSRPKSVQQEQSVRMRQDVLDRFDWQGRSDAYSKLLKDAALRA